MLTYSRESLETPKMPPLKHISFGYVDVNLALPKNDIVDQKRAQVESRREYYLGINFNLVYLSEGKDGAVLSKNLPKGIEDALIKVYNEIVEAEKYYSSPEELPGQRTIVIRQSRAKRPQNIAAVSPFTGYPRFR